MSPRVNFKHILDTSKQTLLRISVMFEWSFTQGIVSLALLPSRIGDILVVIKKERRQGAAAWCCIPIACIY